MEYRVCGGEETGLAARYAVELGIEEARELVEEIYAFLALQTGVDCIQRQPKDSLRRRFGDDLEERVASCLANQCADKIIEREGLAAALEPTVVQAGPVSDGAGFSCEVLIHLKPVVELSSYERVSLELARPSVTEESVEAGVRALVEGYARYVEDPEAKAVDARTTNVVSLDAKKLGMQVHPLTFDNLMCRIGDGRLPAPIEDRLAGMAPGEEKAFSVTLTSKNFLGMEVDERMDCTLRVRRIVKKELPRVDDGWVKEHVPGAHSVESLRALVERTLVERAEASFGRVKEESAVSALARRLPDLELPEAYVEYARAGLLQNVSAALDRQSLSKEELFASQGITEAQFMMQMRARAVEVLRQGLALDAYARHEELALTSDDVSRALRTIAAGNEDETRKVLEMNGRTYQLRETALRSKARARLVAGAEVLPA